MKSFLPKKFHAGSAVITSARSSNKYFGITGDVNKPYVMFGACVMGKFSRSN